MEEPHRNLFERVIMSQYTSLAMGVLLIVTGVFELFEDTFKDIFGFEVHAHHGIIIFGLFQALHALTTIVEGHRYVIERKGE